MVIILTPTIMTDQKFEDKQLVMPTPAERDSWNEIDAKYEHEPINSNWPANKIVNVEDQTTRPETTAYARMVQEKISRAITYPPNMGSSLAGSVKLKLHILKDGSLESEEVVESSGNDTLDHDALNAAKGAAPFDAFTTGMGQADMFFTIPIVYNKIVSGQQAPAEKVIVSY